MKIQISSSSRHKKAIPYFALIIFGSQLKMKYRTRSSVGAVKDVVEKLVDKEDSSKIETLKSTNNVRNSVPVVQHFIRQEIDVPRMWGNVVEHDIKFVVKSGETIQSSRYIF